MNLAIYNFRHCFIKIMIYLRNISVLIFFIPGILCLDFTLSEADALSKSDFIKEINGLYLNGNYRQIIKEAKRIPRFRNLTSDEKKEILYLIGLSYMNMKLYNKAREVFYKILRLKGAQFREESYIAIGHSYFYEGRFGSAIDAYEDILDMYSKSDALSTIYYNLSLCYREDGDYEKAKSYIRKLRHRYSNSFEGIKTGTIYFPEKTRYYIVQLGAFRSLKNARRLARRLSRKGYDSYIQKVYMDNKPIYKVRGGKFSNSAYAYRLARRLRKNGFVAKIISE